MYTSEDIYFNFRKAQAEHNNRGFRMPKDFSSHMEKRMSAKNREALELATDYFNTKWQNIDILKYMECGFQLYKTFSYTQFFNKKVIELYKVRDKNSKREMNICKNDIVKSIKYIKRYKDEITFKQYIQKRDNGIRVFVDHFIKGKIDNFLFVWCLKEKYLILNDAERALVPYIVENYREIIEKLDGIKDFMSKVRSLL